MFQSMANIRVDSHSICKLNNMILYDKIDNDILRNLHVLFDNTLNTKCPKTFHTPFEMAKLDSSENQFSGDFWHCKNILGILEVV